MLEEELKRLREKAAKLNKARKLCNHVWLPRQTDRDLMCDICGLRKSDYDKQKNK